MPSHDERAEPVSHDLRRLASELARAFAERRHLPELIAFVVATFRELLKAEGVAIVLLDRERDELYFPFLAEENPQVASHLSRIRFPAYRGIAGKVLRTGQSLRVDDVAADPWFFGGVDQQTQRTTRSMLCAPLISAHGTIGVIEALNPRGGGQFTDDDLALLDALGTIIASALENVRQHTEASAGTRVAQPGREGDDEQLPVRDQVFAQQGEYWTIRYEGKAFRLKHVKGLAYVAHLLRHPSQEFHAIDLINVVAGRTGESQPGQREPGSSRRGDLGDAGEMLDTEAKAAYKRRLAELQEELREAEAFNDLGRAEAAQQEIESLTQELSRALGLGGRARRAGSHAERARISVTRAIASAVDKIAAHDADLGRHFGATIRTGMFCSYLPDPRAPLAWVV